MACNLLFVGDDPLARRNISILLKKTGYVVYVAESGEAALQLISGVDFDVVVSDLRLRGSVSGIDVLKRQHQKSSGKRLILMAAFGTDQAHREAKALGAVYLKKPILLDDLLSYLQ